MKLSLFLLVSLAALAYCTDEVEWQQPGLFSKRQWDAMCGTKTDYGNWANNLKNFGGDGFGSNLNTNRRKRREELVQQVKDVQQIADQQELIEKRGFDFDDLYDTKRSTYGNQAQIRRQYGVKRSVDVRVVQEDRLRRELAQREAAQNFEKYASEIEKRLTGEYAQERATFEQQFEKRWVSSLVPSETLKKLAAREIQKLDPVIEKRLAETYEQEREVFEREFAKKHVDDLAQLEREIEVKRKRAISLEQAEITEVRENFQKLASETEKRLAKRYNEELQKFEQQFEKRWVSSLIPSETLNKVVTRDVIQKLDPVVQKRLTVRYAQERELFEREFTKKNVDDLAELDREMTKRTSGITDF